MASEFIRRKLRTFFRRFDANGDGFLTRDDFRIIADRATEDNLSRREKTRTDYTKFFDVLNALSGKDEKMTEESLIKAGAKIRTDPKFKNVLDEVIKTCFGLMDTNGDGIIQEKEYIRFLGDLRFRDHENIAKIAFKGLDTNQDGELSFEEFRMAAFDFWTSEDETRPGTLIIGPLIED